MITAIRYLYTASDVVLVVPMFTQQGEVVGFDIPNMLLQLSQFIQLIKRFNCVNLYSVFVFRLFFFLIILVVVSDVSIFILSLNM